jgi:hypothetical protein
MGKCEIYTEELRFKFKPESTEVYSFIKGMGDCPIQVQGVYYKSFPKEISALDILKDMAKNGDVLDWEKKSWDE